MDSKQGSDPLSRGAFTALERERLQRLRKDYEEHKQSQMSASSNRLLFARWLVKTGRLTDHRV